MSTVKAAVVAPKQYFIHRLAWLSRTPVVAGREVPGNATYIVPSVPPPRERNVIPLLIEYHTV